MMTYTALAQRRAVNIKLKSTVVQHKQQPKDRPTINKSEATWERSTKMFMVPTLERATLNACLLHFS